METNQPSPSSQNFRYVMGESNCTLTILDIATTLETKYAFTSGGKAKSGSPIITFGNTYGCPEVSDETYRDVVTYLTSIPTLQEVDLGFVLIVDRRDDRWSSVKTILLRLSDYFPGLVQEVLVLRPAGFFQRTFTDMGYRFVKDEFKFKVVMITSLKELYNHVDQDQLTEDLGGTLKYDHSEWIEHRSAIEKFSANTSKIGQALRDLCQRLEVVQFPNDVESTSNLIDVHDVSRSEVKDDLSGTIKHGDALLKCLRSVTLDSGEEVTLPSTDLPASRVVHVTAVERLLVQLEETEKNFDEFWNGHEKKLKQCLQLRRFEEDFKQIQYMVESFLEVLTGMTEPSDSMPAVDTLIRQLQDLERDSKDTIDQAEQLRADGEQFIEDDHYAVDCIRPKCLELRRMCEQYKELVRQRHALLARSRDFHERIDKANKWCTRGVDLLANQQIEKCTSLEGALVALKEIEDFKETVKELKLSNPKEFRDLFEDIMTADSKVLVQQLLQRIEDVTVMCEKRRDSLRKVTDKPPRPVQAVSPALSTSPRNQDEAIQSGNEQTASRREAWSAKRIDSIHDSSDTDSDNKEGDNMKTYDTLQAKKRKKRKLRRHVMKELIDTEALYVSELESVLQGYANEMDSPDSIHLVPPCLNGKKHILFGNMEEIYNFHNNVFLKDLENCRNTPALVGQYFVKRKDEFQMYSKYCQNKPASEALKKEIGNSPFFKECQRKLDHRLPLDAYLLKPVQRITKYQLLLKEMLKYGHNEEGRHELQEAVDCMLGVLTHVNDVMHTVAITGFPGDLLEQGRLLMRGPFSVWRKNKKDRIMDISFKPMLRHIFLYEKLVLFCKTKEDAHHMEQPSYIYKSHLETAIIGLTENVKSDKKKFEIWLHGRSEVYIMQAPTVEIKISWVAEIKRVLFGQIEKIKEGIRKIHTIPLVSIPSEDNMKDSNRTLSSNNNGSQARVDTTDLVSPEETEGQCIMDAYEAEEDGGWSTSDELEDTPVSNVDYLSEDIADNPQYMALADYAAVDRSGISISEGDVVEVVRMANNGWWYVHHLISGNSGWVPGNFLESAKRRSTYSTQSTTSTMSEDSVDSPGSRLENVKLNSSLDSVDTSGSKSSQKQIISETLV